MGKIHIEFDTQYDKGDVVVFRKDGMLQVGIVEGYYADNNADGIWYNIRINPSTVYTYSNGGDVAEWDIMTKLENAAELEEFISKGE